MTSWNQENRKFLKSSFIFFPIPIDNSGKLSPVASSSNWHIFNFEFYNFHWANDQQIGVLLLILRALSFLQTLKTWETMNAFILSSFSRQFTAESTVNSTKSKCGKNRKQMLTPNGQETCWRWRIYSPLREIIFKIWW